MAKARKDLRGRALHKGEVQRSYDNKYMYTYTDPIGRRKYIYADDLVTLREKEKRLVKDQLDGLDLYAAGRATLENTFDRFISTKYLLRDRTLDNYRYVFNTYVKDAIGSKKLIDFKYSDVLQFYIYLYKEKKLAITTIDSVHSLLHAVFELAVRDDIIRKNPTEGVMKQLKSQTGATRGSRKALTMNQQRAFMHYMADHPIYYHWWPLFTILLGTGCRIGECIGLRWQDLDFENRTIDINHSISYYWSEKEKRTVVKVNATKTAAGNRKIPMIDVVKEAFEMIYEEQKEIGFNRQVIDGMSGFVFQNRFGEIPAPKSINDAINSIVASYNQKELLEAKKEKREPVLLPHFSCHYLRHTFATRLCENETNLKVIQSIMGHKNIETTMDIYADATDTKNAESLENLAVSLAGVF